MIVLGIDPGVKMSGWAVVDGDVLLSCGLARTHDMTAVGRTLDMIANIPKCTTGIDTLVCEVPVIYPTNKQKGDQNALIMLAYAAGGITTLLASRAPLDMRVLNPKPHEWKGGTPKEIHNERVIERVPAIKYHIKDIPKSYQHNVVDAVGLALWGVSWT